MSAVELGFLIQIRYFGAALSKADQKLLTDLGMCHLATAEAHSHLNAVAICKELAGATHFRVQVIGVDTGRHTNLLDFDNALVFLRLFLFFELVEAELAVIHDLTNRGNGIRRNLDEVKLLLLGHGECSLGRNDTEHGTVSADQTYFLVTNLFVELMI